MSRTAANNSHCTSVRSGISWINAKITTANTVIVILKTNRNQSHSSFIILFSVKQVFFLVLNKKPNMFCFNNFAFFYNFRVKVWNLIS